MCVLLLLHYIVEGSFGELFGGQSFTDGWKSMMFEFPLVDGADRGYPTVIGDGLTLVVGISSLDVGL